jgi:hypothetical protein
MLFAYALRLCAMSGPSAFDTGAAPKRRSFAGRWKATKRSVAVKSVQASKTCMINRYRRPITPKHCTSRDASARIMRAAPRTSSTLIPAGRHIRDPLQQAFDRASRRSFAHRCDGESDLASIAQASFTAWISALLVVRSSSVRWRKRGAS